MSRATVAASATQARGTVWVSIVTTYHTYHAVACTRRVRHPGHHVGPRAVMGDHRRRRGLLGRHVARRVVLLGVEVGVAVSGGVDWCAAGEAALLVTNNGS